jgi:hypothetical protein
MDNCKDCLSRRQFLGTSGASVAGMLFANYSNLLLGQDKNTVARAAKAKACIVLWMGGGPSHIDTWDPKPGQDTGGPTKAIETAAKDIEVSENFPTVAKLMNKVSLIRSMTHPEGDHQRATFMMQTGHRLVSAIDYPGSGAIVSFETSPKESDIPHYVAINGNGHGSGFLGVEHYPYLINNPKTALQELEQTAKGVGRASLLEDLNEDFDKQHASENNEKRKGFYEKIKKLIDSPFKKAIDMSKEKPETAKEYGDNNFGQGCLLARRLVETGVKFVQVTMGGWDTHQKNFDAVAKNCKTVDPAMAALIKDLDSKGLLDSTMVIWMGEFGRTPRINGNDGRDHYPKAFSVAIAGGGVQGGRVWGATDPKGGTVVKDPTTVSDLLCTIYGQFGIDLSKKYYTNKTGVVKITEGGTPVKALVE